MLRVHSKNSWHMYSMYLRISFHGSSTTQRKILHELWMEHGGKQGLPQHVKEFRQSIEILQLVAQLSLCDDLTDLVQPREDF
mmetsp:Transcript_29636/g.67084  ORF Transcript_29636/g.67084 Transcript_29636/m.67084 type:complete len:82 (-) Transcript_29636:95-340(-)